jgi:hypothetical protein
LIKEGENGWHDEGLVYILPWLGSIFYEK